MPHWKIDQLNKCHHHNRRQLLSHINWTIDLERVQNSQSERGGRYCCNLYCNCRFNLINTVSHTFVVVVRSWCMLCVRKNATVEAPHEISPAHRSNIIIRAREVCADYDAIRRKAAARFRKSCSQVELTNCKHNILALDL